MSSGKSMQSRRSWERLDGVDLLRGLAIFLVLMNDVNMRLLSADVPTRTGFLSRLFPRWYGMGIGEFRFSSRSRDF